MARLSPVGTGALAYRIKPALAGKVKFFAWPASATVLQVLYSNSTVTVPTTRSPVATPTYDATEGVVNGNIATTDKWAVTPPVALGLGTHQDIALIATYWGNQYLGLPLEGEDDFSASTSSGGNGPKTRINAFYMSAATWNDHWNEGFSAMSQDGVANGFFTFGIRFNYSHPTIKQQVWINGSEQTGYRGNATLTSGSNTTFGGPSNPIYMGATSIGSPATQRQIGGACWVACSGDMTDAEMDAITANPFSAIEATPSDTFSSINVTLAASSINEGNTTTATATVTGSAGVMPGRRVNFSSATPAAATVVTSDQTTDINGQCTVVVTGVAAGTSVINATDFAASANDATPPTVTVVSVTGFGTITIVLGAASLPVGGTTTITATVRGSDTLPMAGRAVTFASGTPATGTVSGNGTTNAQGIVVGTFTAVAAGTSSITATDTTSGTASAGSTATVVADVTGGGAGTGTAGVTPSITTLSLPAGQVAVAYSQQLTANGDTPITWAVVTGSLPAGLTLNTATGLISGTPTGAGTFNLTFSATNSTGSDTKALSIVVAATPATAPTITTTNLPAVAQNASYNQAVTATGTAPITFTLASGSLPAGITLNSAGALTGTPTTPGTYNFTVRADNSAGQATRALSIVVNAVASPGVKVAGLRVSEWKGGVRVHRITVADNSGIGIPGRTVTAVSSDATRVTVTSQATTNANGEASFTIGFVNGGRALITFTDTISAGVARVLAIVRSS